MRNLKKALFYLGLSTLTLSAFQVCAQLPNQQIGGSKQEPAAPQAVPQPASQAAPVMAQKPPVILFKIHNIKPVSNSDGIVSSCEYTATFFNRTPLSLRQARIEFGWTDKVSELYPIDPVTEEQSDTEQEQQPKKAAVPSVEGLGEIRSSIDLPALGSLKQVSVHGTVDTDKCFALFDDLKFRVSVCNVLGQEKMNNNRLGQKDNSSEMNSACASLFAYINSKHPEYYTEFKEISYEDQVAQEKTQEEKEAEFFQSLTKAISENIEKTNVVIGNIK